MGLYPRIVLTKSPQPGDVVRYQPAGNNAYMAFSTANAQHSGLQGIRLGRPSTSPSTFPVGITLEVNNAPQWDTCALDFSTNDLVLAYSHALQADNIRLRPDTAQMAIGLAVGTPPINGPQVSIEGGSVASPKGVLSLTQNHVDDYTLQLLTSAQKRVKVVFGGQGATGFQMGTDFAKNGSNDFFLYNNAVAQNAILISAANDITTSNLSASNLKWSGLLSGNGVPPTYKPGTITPPSDADYTLTASEAECPILTINQGSWTIGRNIIVPSTATGMGYWVRNNTSVTVTIKNAGGAGAAVATGKIAWVMSPGGVNFLLGPST